MSQSRSSPSLVHSNAKKEDKVLSHSEIVDRFKVLLQKATDFVFMSGMGQFICFVYYLMPVYIFCICEKQNKKLGECLFWNILLFIGVVCVILYCIFHCNAAWSSVESVGNEMPSGGAPETFSLFLLELLLSAAATITQRKGKWMASFY